MIDRVDFALAVALMAVWGLVSVAAAVVATIAARRSRLATEALLGALEEANLLPRRRR